MSCVHVCKFMLIPTYAVQVQMASRCGAWLMSFQIKSTWAQLQHTQTATSNPPTPTRTHTFPLYMVLYSIELCPVVLCSIVLYCIVSYCIVLYCTVLYCILAYLLWIYLGYSFTHLFSFTLQQKQAHCRCLQSRLSCLSLCTQDWWCLAYASQLSTGLVVDGSGGWEGVWARPGNWKAEGDWLCVWTHAWDTWGINTSLLMQLTYVCLSSCLPCRITVCAFHS